MNTILSEATAYSIVLAVIRLTLVLGIAWFLYYSILRSNVKLQIVVWRFAVVCAFASCILCLHVRGWGPQLYNPISISDFQYLPPLALNEVLSTSAEKSLSTTSKVDPTDSKESKMEIGDLSKGDRNPDQVGLSWMPSVPIALLLIYVFVFACSVVRMAIQYVAIRTLLRSAHPAAKGHVAILGDAAKQVRLSTSPRLLLSSSIDIPFAVGIRQPTIVLPVSITKDFSAEDLEMVLVHECGHFAGRDLAWSFAIQLLQIIAWPNPLCWSVERAHRFACDVRCDEPASKKSPSSYRALLAKSALRAQASECTGLVMGFVQRSETLKRIRLIETDQVGPDQVKQRPIRVSRRLGLVLGMAMLLAAATFGVNHFVNGGTKYVNMKVVGPNGQPIYQATILVDGLRAKKEGASAYPNPRQAASVTTDVNGMAYVPFPKYVLENLETGAIIYRVTHPDFIEFESQGSFVDTLIQVTLNAGRHVELSLIDVEGRPASENVFFLQSSNPPSEWHTVGDGVFRSPPLGPSESPLLAVARYKDSFLFSDLLRLNSVSHKDIKLEGIRLTPGRKLNGTLSDNVPRPVRNGKVGLTIAASDSAKPTFKQCTSWNDFVDIQEDGTFVFESIPRDSEVQLLATCDDWVSVSPSPSQILERFPYVTTEKHSKSMKETIVIAQRYSLDKSSVTVDMEPTAQCEFIIVDGKGAPIANVFINVSPNTAVSPGPGGIVGFYFKSDTLFSKSHEQIMDERRRIFEYDRRMSCNVGKTDSDGRAVIKNLPMKRSIGISIQHENFELPIPDANPFHRSTHVDMSAGSTQMKITLQPIGTQVLGR